MDKFFNGEGLASRGERLAFKLPVTMLGRFAHKSGVSLFPVNTLGHGICSLGHGIRFLISLQRTGCTLH